MEVVKGFSGRIAHIQHKMFREALSEKQYKELSKQLDGECGELLFSQYIKAHSLNAVIFHDLRFLIQNKEIQIDCLAIMQDELFIFEIKWSNHDLQFVNDCYLFLDSDEEVISYRQQKSRICEFFQYFLKRHQLNYKLHFYNVFVNPQTFVYGVPKHSNCLNQREIEKFLRSVSSVPLFKNHDRLTSILLTKHMPHSQYARDLQIDFSTARKGVLCSCRKQVYFKKTKRLYACSCGEEISSQEYLRRCIKELTLLFPNELLTVNHIYEWSDRLISKRTIREYINKYYVKDGKSRKTHYIKE